MEEILKNLFRFVYKGVLSGCVCMYILCVPGVQGGQRTVVHPLEVELQLIVSYHVGA